jgi:5-methylcytosine-specific restriction protein B
MADVICRWRNATPKTVCEFVQHLPHEQMSSEDFRLRMGNDFFHTAYQLACQLGLYLEDQDKYIPRFTHSITEDEAREYLEHWIQCYYAPNPFTKSLKGLAEPVFVLEELVKYLEQHDSSANLKDALTNIFHDPMGNMDIMTNALNNYSKVIVVKNGYAKLETNYKDYMKQMPNRNDKEAFFKNFDTKLKKQNVVDNSTVSNYRPYITAIKSKPFLLLAGISGTGKSRIVRELARACWEEGTDEYKAQKPKNFQMVQVKPNWHDSSDLIGYVSRVSGKAEFVAGEFLKFIAKAWENTETPYFLCLDEMNLAPVEQYFAEYLSVIESRKNHEDGTVTTDPILEKSAEDWYRVLTSELTNDDNVRNRFLEEGICIPQNFIVVGTVNMDETTFSFSRKVLDRAMTIEMNEVDLHGGLTKRHESIGKLGNAELVGSAVEGVDVYNDYTDVCDIALGYLQKVNDVLEGTPFKVAYRTRNEFLLYVVNNLPYCKDENGNDLEQGYVIARALDEITSMKVLSRIEGDDTKVSDELLDNLSKAIEDGLKTVSGEENTVKSISLAKLKEMKAKLVSGYTSFWS